MGPETTLSNLKSATGLAVDTQNDIWVTGVSTEGTGMLIELARTGESSLTPEAPYLLSFVPGHVVIRGAFAWVLNTSDSGPSVYKISLSDGTVAKTYSLGGKAADLYIDAAGDFWLPIVSQSKVVKLDF